MSEVSDITNNNKVDNMLDYVCSDCDHKFQSRCHLERHRNSKRKCKRKSDDHKCSNCNKNYSNKYNLATHMKKCCGDNVQLDNDVQDTNDQHNNVLLEDIKILDTTTDINTIRNGLIDELFNNMSPNNEMIKKLLKYLFLEQSILINELKTKNDIKELNIPNVTQPIQATSNSNSVPLSEIGLSSNVQVNVQNQNVQNNIIQNNVINNNLILPPVINPFGYEDISHISDEEKLRILTSPNGLELGLKLLYNKVSNRNFYRPNANKDNIAILDTDLKVQIKDKKSFNDDMLEKGIVVMYRLLDSCKTKLSFKDKLMIEQNITRNRDMLRFDNYIRCVLNLIETCLQDNVSKDIFKKFSDKLSREETFRKEKLKLVKQLIDELKKFNTEFNNISITDEYLKSEVWYIDESRNDDMDPHDIRNNLENNYIENTARYKMLEKMKEEEHKYFEDHDISLGNLRQYRMIQLDRARQEIELMNEIYKDDMLKEELENKLLNKNNDNFDSNLSRVKFIQEDNMLDI